MFLTESFHTQLDDLLERICLKLQLSPTQHKLAEDRYMAIANWLEVEGSPLQALLPIIYPQGSLRIGTTVKPWARQEYDLDFVCELQADWRQTLNPLALLDVVEGRLCSHETYKPMVERKNRCIRVKYANEFHMDILPACPDPASGSNCLMVPDCEAQAWRPSNPKGYATWFEAQTEISQTFAVRKAEPLPAQESVEEKAPLKRAVQLLKRWRDISYAQNPDLAPVSIVLTTLAAQHYGRQGSVNETLMGILNGIVASLPPRGKRLVVLNPMNLKEDLSERWDENSDAYSSFVTNIILFSKQWEELNKRRGIQLVSAALEGLFGEDTAKNVVAEQAEYIEKVRSAQSLGMEKTSGRLSSLMGIGVIPIQSNIFYGK